MPKTPEARLLRGRYGSIVSKADLTDRARKDSECRALDAEILRYMDRVSSVEGRFQETMKEYRAAARKARKALERINRARRAAFERALIAWKKREARKLELMKILRMERVEKLKAKFNLNRPPITMPVQERVAFFRMRREIGYKLPKQKLERETEEQAEFFPTANGPGPTGNSCPNGPANGQS